MKAMSIKVLAAVGPKVQPGQWIEAGTTIGISSDLTEEVKAPVTGVIKDVSLSFTGYLLEIVLERRRDYDEIEH